MPLGRARSTAPAPKTAPPLFDTLHSNYRFIAHPFLADQSRTILGRGRGVVLSGARRRSLGQAADIARDSTLAEKGKAAALRWPAAIVDASIVPVPIQRNSREENRGIKEGEVPEDWSEAKREQKDIEARWTRKNGKTFFGYKNHIDVDAEHKLIRTFAVTPANVHDSQVLDELALASLPDRSLLHESTRVHAGRSKKTGVKDVFARCASTSSQRPKRLIVTWNGCGRPAAVKATTAPSSQARPVIGILPPLEQPGRVANRPPLTGRWPARAVAARFAEPSTHLSPGLACQGSCRELCLSVRNLTQRRAIASREWKRSRIMATPVAPSARAKLAHLAFIGAGVRPRRCSIRSCRNTSRASSRWPTIRPGRGCPATWSGISASTSSVEFSPMAFPVRGAKTAVMTT